MEHALLSSINSKESKLVLLFLCLFVPSDKSVDAIPTQTEYPSVNQQYSSDASLPAVSQFPSPLSFHLGIFVAIYPIPRQCSIPTGHRPHSYGLMYSQSGSKEGYCYESRPLTSQREEGGDRFSAFVLSE